MDSIGIKIQLHFVIWLVGAMTHSRILGSTLISLSKLQCLEAESV